MSSRIAQKTQAREARLAAQRAVEHAEARKRRLTMLAGVVVAAALIVIVAVVASRSGTTQKVSSAERVALFDGIPQDAGWLGAPGAAVVVEEYADPQCPYCADFATRDLPAIVKDYVRPGAVRMRMQTLTFLGPDSVEAGRAAAAAGLQDRQWQFMEAFYAAQGQENTGYVTSSFLRDIAAGIPGLDVDRVMADRASRPVAASLRSAHHAATAAGVQSTPTFRVGPAGGHMVTVTGGELRGAIDAALAQR